MTLVEIVVAYAPPPDPNGYTKTAWELERFQPDQEEAAIAFQLIKKNDGKMALRLYRHQELHGFVWHLEGNMSVIISEIATS